MDMFDNLGHVFKMSIAAISCFNVNDDPVLRGFAKLFGKSVKKSAKGWAQIIGALAPEGQTLGGYFEKMILYSNSPIAEEIAKHPTGLGREALKSDLKMIEKFVEIDPVVIETNLRNYYNSEGFDFASLPLYDSGNFDITVDDYIDFVQHCGSGIFAKYRAFSYDGQLSPIKALDPIRISELCNYQTQRKLVIENTQCFLADKPAQNVLLYGDRGTGKSATVKAILNEYEPLRLVEVSKSDINKLPKLFEKLRNVPLHFIVFIDDLSFAENDDRFGILKAALEGSVAAKPENVLIYATTNRRKIIRETAAEREISGTDAIDESMSLSDRFGLFVTFTRPDKRGYLEIVNKMAAKRGLNISKEELETLAEQFALKSGGRSPRTARQLIDRLYGQEKL